MPVVNITPQDGLRHFAAGTVPGSMHVYCMGPDQTQYVIQIGNGEPTAHRINAGYSDKIDIGGQAFIFRNYGPSTLQLLYTTPADLDAVSEPADPSLEKRFRPKRKS